MTESSVLKQLTGRLAVPAPRDTAETDSTEDLGAFGWLRGVGDRAIMLQLRLKDGSVEAFSYSWLERAGLDPSAGITLKFGRQTVRIVGRSLNAEIRPNVRLFDGLVRHRVPWIQEADRRSMVQMHSNGLAVETIEVG